MRGRRRPVGTVACALAALALCAAGGVRTAVGAEWYAAPSVRLQAGYDQNPRFLVNHSQPTDFFGLAPSLEVGARAPNWGGRAIGSVDLRRYPRLSELNRTDKNVAVFSHYDTPRLSWRLDGSYRLSSILGTTQPGGPQTPFVQFQSQVSTGTASPSVTWQVTPADQLQAAYTFQDTSYQDAATLGLSSFRYHQGSLTYQHAFSPRLQVFASPSYSVFDVPASGFQSRTAGLQLGVLRVFSPTLSATVAVGGRRTEAQGVQIVPTLTIDSFGQIRIVGRRVNVSSLNTGVTVNASFTKRLERGSLTGSFTRDLSPSGIGAEIETNTLNLTLDRPFTARLAGHLSLNLYRTRSVGATLANNSANRDWVRVNPGLSWQWTPRTTVDLSYSYAWTRLQAGGQIARDNVIYLTLSYRWPRITLSR